MAKRLLNPTQTMFIEGRVAGDRSMREAGRTRWNVEDWNAAAAEVQRLMDFHNNIHKTNEKARRFYLKKAAEYVAHGQFAAARRMFECAELNKPRI